MKFTENVNRVEARLFAIKLARIPIYWWILAVAVLAVALLSWSLLADAQAYENQAQPL